ncbi:MAG TPA: type IX secretion system membrane protein PorP/SprF [Cytophagaceae bacterium]|nr:type IX secretion system membrane protein PorP/SprF [Cytophagaceae bacterium]
MLFRLGNLFLCISLLIVQDAYGQHYNDYSNATDIFFRNYTLINPAVGGSYAPVELSMDYHGLNGVFSQVRNFYGSANFRLKEKQNRRNSQNKQVLGTLWYGEKEGEFFGKTRGYLQYSYHIGLQENLFLSAGISAGLVSYSYKSSTASAGGSTNGLTGNLGLWLYSDKMHLGISSQDVPNTTLKPIDAPILLSRFYTLTFDRSFLLSHTLRLTPAAEFIYYGKKYNTFSAGAWLVIQNTVSAGVLYKWHQGYVCSVGFEKIRLFQGKTNFFFTYKVPSVGANQLPVSAIEITMNYFLTKLKAGEPPQLIEEEQE